LTGPKLGIKIELKSKKNQNHPELQSDIQTKINYTDKFFIINYQLVMPKKSQTQPIGTVFI
jgi:hypothetical protein